MANFRMLNCQIKFYVYNIPVCFKLSHGKRRQRSFSEVYKCQQNKAANIQKTANMREAILYKKQKEPKWSLRRKAIIIVSVILGLSLLMLMGVVGYAYSMLSGMHENPDDFKGGDVAEATDSPEDIVGLAELTDPECHTGPAR